MDIINLILSAVIGLVVWGFYHKIFSVTYFSLGAIGTELFVCFMIGFVIINFVGKLILLLFTGFFGLIPMIIAIFVAICIIAIIISAVK